VRASRALLWNPLQLNWGVRPPQPSMRHRLSREQRLDTNPMLRGMVQHALLSAFLLTLGCTGWQSVPVDAVPSRSATLRVQLRDGTSVIIREATVRADSIVGVRSGSMPLVPVAVALTQVARIEVAETDRSKTAKVIIGVAIFGAAAFALALVWAFSHVHT